MLRLNQMKLPLEQKGQLMAAVCQRLRVKPAEIRDVRILREALDARRQDIFWVYTLDVALNEGTERRLLKKDKRLQQADAQRYRFVEAGTEKLRQRPLVIGAGPAGLMAALQLAEQGYAPLLLERGADLPTRIRAVERFRSHGELDAENNVQFGEGGAGTFSDGKLATQIHDPRLRRVLEQFVTAGADPAILYEAAAHIGTDKLREILVRMRQRILDFGGAIRFGQRLERLLIKDKRLIGIELAGGERLDCTALILAIGHSARDTYAMLAETGVPLQAKPFAMGLRIEQLQSWIDEAQYGGMAGHPLLGAASYKLSYRLSPQRTAYTFCMCPGGEVIASASEPGYLVTNGMSYAARAGVNANAALLVNVAPSDFGSGPLDGVVFQRHWEAKAFQAGGSAYRAPLQRVDDFLAQELKREPVAVQPSYLPGVQLADLGKVLPSFVADSLRQALPELNRMLPRFADPQSLLTGIESRSSAPLRILRDDGGESAIGGLFPAGEGAGYAGGIVSAGVDGIRAAEAIIRRYRPFGE